MYDLVGREKRALVAALQSTIIWKIVPLLSLCSFADYLCRCNVAFESEALKTDIGLSDIQFGASASFFFLGYTVFQLPSNLILSRCSAMCWLPCLAIGWCVLMLPQLFMSFISHLSPSFSGAQRAARSHFREHHGTFVFCASFLAYFKRASFQVS